MYFMQSKSPISRSLFLSLPLFAVSLTGCLGGGLTLRNTSETVVHKGYSYDQVFTAAREALNEHGITILSSRDQRLIVGQIPPFKVKAIFEPDSGELHLEGVELDRNCWTRDSLKREWVHACEGEKLRRKGVNTLDGAIALWTDALRRRVP